MLGPDTAARLEVRRLGGVPVLGVGDQGACRTCPLELAVDQRHDLLAVADVEAALGVGEVVLYVDDDQRRRPVVVDHCTALLGGCRPHHAPPRMRSGLGGSPGQLADLPIWVGQVQSVAVVLDLDGTRGGQWDEGKVGCAGSGW
jgi:hypothetical protein